MKLTKQDIVIAGIGQTDVGELWDVSLRDLGVRAIQAAREDAGGQGALLRRAGVGERRRADVDRRDDHLHGRRDAGDELGYSGASRLPSGGRGAPPHLGRRDKL